MAHYVLEILGRNRIKSTRCSEPGGANMRDLRNQLLQLLVALVGWGVLAHTPTFSDINNGSENKLKLHLVNSRNEKSAFWLGEQV